MRLVASFAALFLSITLVAASGLHDTTHVVRHHALAALRARAPAEKRCPNRVLKGAKKSSSSSSSSSSSKTKTSTSKKPKATKAAVTTYSNRRVIDGPMSACGPPNATPHTTKTGGPNGSMAYLNCGVNGSGWNPPKISIDKFVTVPLHDAIKKPGSPFKSCAAFIHLFEKYGAQYNIPPIVLASFAMQESSCNPRTIGQGGEMGLMQITKEKCGAAPGGDCLNPDYNIKTATAYFRGNLDRLGGNTLLALGGYNGWPEGMTIQSATRARYSECCRCQNNLDYIHQTVNGWWQNINAYDSKNRLGMYFNLDPCDQ